MRFQIARSGSYLRIKVSLRNGDAVSGTKTPARWRGARVLVERLAAALLGEAQPGVSTSHACRQSCQPLPVPRLAQLAIPQWEALHSCVVSSRAKIGARRGPTADQSPPRDGRVSASLVLDV